MSEIHSTPSSQIFPLSTLGDIFNLPTREQMVLCLKEVAETMIQARATHDLITTLMHETVIPVSGKPFEWPKVINWVDDGKGEIETRYLTPDGKEIFSMKVGSHE
jgi:hypothetical protein